MNSLPDSPAMISCSEVGLLTFEKLQCPLKEKREEVVGIMCGMYSVVFVLDN